MVRRYKGLSAADGQRMVLETFRRLHAGLQAVGESPADRLRWLSDFLRREVPADTLDEVTATLNWFVLYHYRAWGGDFDGAADVQQLIKADDVLPLHQQLRQMLGALTPGGIVWFPQPIGHGLKWGDGSVMTVTKGGGLPQVLAAVVDLLVSVGPRLRRCKTPSCQRLFATTRPHQLHCTTKCATLFRVRKSRNKNRDQHLEARHQQYVRKVKAQKPNVRVARRARKAKGE